VKNTVIGETAVPEKAIKLTDLLQVKPEKTDADDVPQEEDKKQ